MKVDNLLKYVIGIVVIINIIIFEKYQNPPQFSFMLLIILILFALVRLINKKRINTKGFIFKIHMLTGILNFFLGLTQLENLLYFVAFGLSWIYVGAIAFPLSESKK